MPHQALDGVEIPPRFQEMRGEGVTKYMQPTRLGNPCTIFGPLEHEVGGFTGEWLGAIPAGKKPGSRAIDALRGPQGLQEV